ncbi:hypothetical protein PybrP1_006648 [[Pythium] brassicae (nom. inval.)]|nr:hypothetical protein PybrP1_006648 [[Pythium] brassicae (nom. inval.)]
MRFRGTLAKDALEVLLDVSLFFTRLGAPSCVFTVTPETLSLALKSGGDELQSFARLQCARLFGAGAIVQSRADNHIGFSCDVRHLHQALASGRDGSAVMLRLLKRDGRSFLCLRTRAVDIDIVQSVPIEVLAMSTVAHFREPSVPAPQLAMEMPPLRAIRGVVERLRALHRTITVEASRRGTLRFRIDSAPLALQTLFAHLRYRADLIEPVDDDANDDDDRGGGGGRDPERDSHSYSVTVDAKVLSKAILVDSNSAETVLCCITENRAMVLHSILLDGFGSFTCYIPVLTPDVL